MKNYEQSLDEANLEKLIINDKVNNKEYLDPLVRLLASIDDNETICIDGDWGSGKTVLVKQLEYLINNVDKNVNNLWKLPGEEMYHDLEKLNQTSLTFYYNAWENDDHENALESIIYNILNEYPKYQGVISGKPTKEDTLKEILGALVKVLTHGVVSGELIEKVETFKDLADNIYTIEEKRKDFEKLINIILNGKRMILIIDELDRCNPDFACKLLETIKHFYNLKNITVIIAANNKELIEIIKKHFGTNFDAYSYLNKFYDFVMNIDNSRSQKYCQDFLDLGNSYLPHDVSRVMIKKYNMTFRECNRYRLLYDSVKEAIEKKYNYGSYLTNEENYVLNEIITPIILIMKVKDIDNYNKILIENYEPLKEALSYVQQEFKNIGYETWLNEFTKIDKKDPTDEEIVTKIIEIFKEAIKTKNIRNIFMDKIRIGFAK